MTSALVTCHHLVRHFPRFAPQFEALGVKAVVPPIKGQQFDAADMRQLIKGVAGVIAGDDVIDASVLEAGKASALKVVVKWGIGTDSIDKPAAARIGIPVYNVPGVFSDEVADLALSLLLNLVRGTHIMHQSVVDGGWRKVEGRTLAGMTAGVIGLGSIGLGIARRTTAFGMSTIGYDVVAQDAARLAAAATRQAPLDEVLRQADVLLLACNLTPENRHLINARALASMKRGAMIVNVSRGPLIDEAALAAALASGHIGGVGLDVFEVEPLPASSPLRTLPNCVFATHNGSNTLEAVARVNQMTCDILFDCLGLKKAAFQPNRVA